MCFPRSPVDGWSEECRERGSRAADREGGWVGVGGEVHVWAVSSVGSTQYDAPGLPASLSLSLSLSLSVSLRPSAHHGTLARNV